MRIKIIKKGFIILSLISLMPVTALGFSGSGGADTAGIQEGMNGAANGAYGAQRAASCGPHNAMACIQAGLGFAQMAMSLMQMMQSMQGRDSLSDPSYDWSNPNFGTEFGTIDPSDEDYVSPIIDAIEGGEYDDYENAYNKLMKKGKGIKDKLNEEGYTLDLEKGTISGHGQTHSLADSSLSDSGASKIADYTSRAEKALGKGDLDTSGGGGMIAASSGGSGSGAFGRGLASGSSRNGSGKSVDNFLNKLDQGKVDDKKMSGMSKLTEDGERIGVAMNDIFKMIRRKYTSIDKNKEFLENK